MLLIKIFISEVSSKKIGWDGLTESSSLIKS